MKLEESMNQNRADLVEKWGDLILSTYPEETRKIWKNKKDRFQNPVGVTIYEAAGKLFDLILEWNDADKMAAALDDLVKIRAVQNFTPSQAVSFVYLLKKLLRDEFLETLRDCDGLEELMAFETRIDNLALISFDIYCKDRENIYRMRVNEVKKSQHNLLRRAKMIVDVTAPEAEE